MPEEPNSLQEDIAHTGTFLNRSDRAANEFKVFDVNGIRVGIVTFTFGTNGKSKLMSEAGGKTLVSRYSRKQLRRAIDEVHGVAKGHRLRAPRKAHGVLTRSPRRAQAPLAAPLGRRAFTFAPSTFRFWDSVSQKGPKITQPFVSGI